MPTLNSFPQLHPSSPTCHPQLTHSSRLNRKTDNGSFADAAATKNNLRATLICIVCKRASEGGVGVGLYVDHHMASHVYSLPLRTGRAGLLHFSVRGHGKCDLQFTRFTSVEAARCIVNPKYVCRHQHIVSALSGQAPSSPPPAGRTTFVSS